MSKSNIFVFAAGLIVGGIGGWLATKDYYAKKADADVASVKETYYRRNKVMSDAAATVAKEDAVDPNNKQIKQVLDDLEDLRKDADKAYTAYRPTEEDTVEEPRPIYAISPDSCGETGYEVISLTYYADGIMCDDDDQIMHDPELYVGEDFEKQFGKFAKDEVTIRNEDRRTDYDICRDFRTYEDVIGDTVPPYDR